MVRKLRNGKCQWIVNVFGTAFRQRRRLYDANVKRDKGGFLEEGKTGGNKSGALAPLFDMMIPIREKNVYVALPANWVMYSW